jgi:hypothetical protein
MTEPDLETAGRRPGARSALITSLGILGFLLAQNLGYRLIRAAQEARYDVGSFGADAGSTWVTELAMAVGLPLIFALGIFVCFWQLAPITRELRLAQVATRSVLAATIGAACTWVFKFFAGLIYVATTPELRAVPDPLGGVAFDAGTDSLGTLVGLLPLVLLGAVLLWGWLRSRSAQAPSPVGVTTLKP